jgi:3'(2'), 5'-bisphosphate nucleotidase
MTDLTPLIHAVRQAADLCRRVQQSRFVRNDKGVNDPVTIADYGSQVILLRAIRRHFPDDGILSEEQGEQFMTLLTDAQRSEIAGLLSDVLGETIAVDAIPGWLDHNRGLQTPRVWCVDPVDGTKGFINMRHYTIAVGVLQNGAPADALLGCPGYPSDDGRGAMFYTRNGAAYREPMDGGEPVRLRVSTRTDMATVQSVESVEWAHSDLETMARIRERLGIPEGNVLGVDSQEKYGRVAEGMADFYFRLPRNQKDNIWIWDHAAGTALVVAAGGRVSDLRGEPLDFSQGRVIPNDGVVVTNGHIHHRVVEAIRAVLAAS